MQKLLPIGQLCKKSWEFYKAKFYTILTLACIPFVGFLAASLFSEGFDRPKADMFLAGFGLLFVLLFLVMVAISFWVQMAFFYLILKKDSIIDVKSLLKISWSNLISLAWVTFLTGVIVVGGFILLIIPGIIFSIWFSLALYVFVFEDMKGMKALHRSRQLVKGYWWAVFGRFLLFGLITGVISAIPVIGDVVNIFLLMPVGVIYGYFIYEDLKQIKAVSVAN